MIKKFFKALYVKTFNPSLKTESINLLGKQLIVTKGAIREKADQDDAWFYALATNHNIIYDIGANIGYDSLLATLKDKSKRIVLIDANKVALTYAAQNLITNQLSLNKIFIVGAMTDKKGTMEFHTLGTAPAGSLFKDMSTSASMVHSSLIVSTDTIDNVINDTGIIPELVKIDIEGAEIIALKGAIILALGQKCKFIVEMHSSKSLTMLNNAQGAIDWCRANNYIPYYLKEHTQLTSANTIAHRGRCHLLLLPKNVKYPEYLQNIKEGSDIGL